jgi:molybdopterin-guanine dinucleotide biosynthesis protein A
VLTGGSSRRLGRDKATTHVGGRRLVDRVMDAVPAGVPVVFVGPPLDGLARPAVFVREEPAGSGPLAGIGAGMALVGTPLVGVLAADMPFAVPVVVEALLRLSGVDPEDPRAPVGAVVPVDDLGYRQPLCAAYRTDALRAALATLQPLAGLPVRALLTGLAVVEWVVPAAVLADVDTEQELADVRASAAEEDWDMQEWVDAVREALGVDVVVDIDTILDVARDAAHAVDRPAAPVTTYLIGGAVAAGADPAGAAAAVGELARGWAERTR